MKTVLLHVKADVRFWEDATVNGIEDNQGLLIPFRVGDCWCPIINLNDGRINNWPIGTTAKICYKVCDEGEYWLSGEDQLPTHKWAGDYVPDRFLAHGDRGFGDYIILQINADGKIENYSKPQIHEAEWKPIKNS